MQLTWSTVGGKRYVAQTNRSLSTNFADFSPPISAPSPGGSTTNLVDSSAVTNAPARCYRVRLGL